MVPLLRSPCEKFMKRFSTSIRIALALELINNYNKTQLEAARLLDIPQPLINYVVTGRRKVLGLDRIRSYDEAMKIIEDVAKKLVSGEVISMCSICSKMKDMLCET